MNDPLSPKLRLIGRYAVLRELRRDRSSVTYIGMDPVMHREVILKAVRLPPPATLPESNDAQIAPLEAAFVRQAQAAGKLHHPHIVTVFDAGRVHDVAYLAIERVAGRSLAELLAGGWRPDFVHCASIGARIADALEHAHVQSLAHGHLGPQHVLVQGDGAPKVEGFGGWIDGGTAGEDALVRTEKLLPYFQNELTEDARHRDVRAVTALLHMMLTGKAPQAEANGRGVRTVFTLRPDTPLELARIVDQTLAADHPAGFRTAADLRDALTAFLWSERNTHVASGTLGIPLAAAPPQTDTAPATATVLPTPPDAAGPEPRSRAATLASARPATLSARPATMAAVAPATAQPGAGGEAPTVPRPDPEPALRAADPEPSLAVASGDLAHMAWQRSLQWLNAHRAAAAAVAGLIAFGVILGVLLATLASRPGGTGAEIAAALPSMDSPANQAKIAPATPAFGIVTFDITPWGEVLVDNKAAGVTPPLKELKLTAGRHVIEIRHGELPAVAATIEIDPAKPQRIRHRFQ